MSDGFEDDLACTLAVWCAGVPTAVPGANLKRLRLSLAPHGFSGEVAFWVRADAAGEALHQVLTGDAPLELELGVARARYLGTPPPPLAVRGAVVGRRFVELTTDDIAGRPVRFRRYQLALEDPARAAWSLHHPTQVFVDKSLADVVRAQLVGDMALEVAWPEIAQKRALVCLGLGEDDASFHDFVAWLAASHAGHFTLDYAGRGYRLSERKARVADPAALDREAVAELEVLVPEPARHQQRFLNSWIGMDAVTAVDLVRARPPLTRDVLVHTPIPRDVSTRVDRDARRLAAGRHELAVRFGRFPEVLLAPGAGLTLEDETFSPKLAGFGETLRVAGLELSARALDESAEFDLELASTVYAIELSARLEHEDDPRTRVPAFRTPRYPIELEGRIVSAVGATGDRAYTVYEDDTTSQDRYRVLLPTWNVTIEVPFTPLFQPGHLYFPAYRDARVLVAVSLDRARLTSFLDWGPSVRLPLASQGNHILFGKNTTSETSLRHWYVDSLPELQLRRAHSGNIGVVAVKEGAILIETFDDDDAATGAATVSVQPEAAAAQASLEASSDVAVTDLEGSVTGASGELDGKVEDATGAVDQSVAAVKAEVQQSVADTSATLRGLSDEAEAQSTRARNAVADARARLAALFDGGGDDP
ncbi:MAG TPA: hypothetical protein VGD37_20550 [Kofleriaceae bacterium]